MYRIPSVCCEPDIGDVSKHKADHRYAFSELQTRRKIGDKETWRGRDRGKHVSQAWCCRGG